MLWIRPGWDTEDVVKKIMNYLPARWKEAKSDLIIYVVDGSRGWMRMIIRSWTS